MLATEADNIVKDEEYIKAGILGRECQDEGFMSYYALIKILLNGHNRLQVLLLD